MKNNLSTSEKWVKRGVDLIASLVGIGLLSPILILGFILASLSTNQNGIYRSKRIGQFGKEFYILKLRSMRRIEGVETSVTTTRDPRITGIGAFLRKYKIDELPQLFNVLLGQMSLVGPRPDVTGFADNLTDNNAKILLLKPGITGLATLAFKNEEELLARQNDPIAYNREVIWPEKIRLNKYYLENYSLTLDIKILFKTVFT
ncbi:sugar transferase [Mesonia sp. HuA40]|uniref:sugar transferase n=1 Tax=Mesonia sp. HuA40 TaxID=2602761 RepID=UPI0011CC13F4|nr:sugar transferase [Mesonia sp. HuA40]TXK73237.1 sugar transferase [Mesonia sp. HuA40]